MRVIFFGTPSFAIPALASLMEAHDVAAVVTQPDRPRGRGQNVTPSPVKLLADAHHVPVLQPTRLRVPEWTEAVAALRADIGVVAAYGRLLPQALLDLPRLGFINVHASLLPRWRGAAPVHRAVLAGDSLTGVTIMRVILALDAGPTLASADTPIDPTETSPSLEARLAAMGARLLLETMTRMDAGPVEETPQDETLVTYASRLERTESRIDWTRPAAAIDRQIRGLQPWPLASALVAGKRVAFLQSAVEEPERTGEAPGTVVSAGANGLVIACHPGTVRITEVLPDGRRAMPAGAFLNGTPMAAGDTIHPLPVPPGTTP